MQIVKNEDLHILVYDFEILDGVDEVENDVLI